MKTFKSAAAVVAFSALAIAGTAASAQSNRNWDQGGRYQDAPRYSDDSRRQDRGDRQVERDFTARLNDLSRAIDRGQRRGGGLTEREAHMLSVRVAQAVHRVDMYRRDGYTRQERADLETRVANLERQLRIDTRDASNDRGRDRPVYR